MMLLKKMKEHSANVFLDNLKEKQLIANTFIASDPIKKRSIKLFFSEVYISRL